MIQELEILTDGSSKKIIFRWWFIWCWKS